MLAVAATALVLAGPPPATIGGKRLAVSSWCWGARCGAPIAASARTVRFRRGATVRVELAFEPAAAHLSIAGRPLRVTTRDHEVSWVASRSGGFTLNVTSARGWVTYVGRIRLR